MAARRRGGGDIINGIKRLKNSSVLVILLFAKEKGCNGRGDGSKTDYMNRNIQVILQDEDLGEVARSQTGYLRNKEKTGYLKSSETTTKQPRPLPWKQRYKAFYILPQLYTANHATFPN